MDTEFLSVRNLVRKEDSIFSLQGISLRQKLGERLAIVGETGSGKSSLLKVIAGLIQPDSGTAIFNGERVKGPLEQLIPGHPQIAYLSQHFELRNHYRVHEVLEMSQLVDEDEAKRIREVCRISHLLQRRTNQISGGERQRIALARLLGTAPKLLILDEPFSNLDLPHKLSLLEVLEDAAARLGTSFLLAAHDPLDVMGWAERVLVLRKGSIVAEGSPESLYTKPVNSYVAGLFGKYNLVSYGKQKVMLRPEDLVIDPNPGIEGSLLGNLKNQRFQGFFQELSIDIDGQTLLAFVLDTKRYRIGQQVRVAVRKKLVVPEDWMTD